MARDARELIQLSEQLWIAETDFKMIGVNVGNRMTVMRSQNGKLTLHSPVHAETRFMDRIATLGTPTCLIAPNHFHYLHLAVWRSRFPDAPVIAPATQTKIQFNHALTDGPLTAMDEEITMVAINGCPRLSEYAVIHHPSQTLILTDLAFNFRSLPGIWGPLLARLYGAYGRFGPSYLVKSLVKDRAAFGASLAKVMTFDFDRIIVSHGDVVQRGGKQLFADAFAQYLA